MGTHRIILQHNVPLEQSSSGEVDSRPVSFVAFMSLTRARPGAENVLAGNTVLAAPIIYRVRLDSLPPGLTTDWTLIDEDCVEHDIISIQPVPRPPRSRMREIKCVRRT